MRRLKIYLACFLEGLLIACTVFVCPAFSQDSSILLESIQVDPTLEGATIEVKASRPFSFVTYTLTDPDRLVIDLLEPHVESSLASSASPQGGLIRSFRLIRAESGLGVAQPLAPAAGSGTVFGGRPVEPGSGGGVDYLEFQLTQPAEHLVESTLGKLLIRVRPVRKVSPADSFKQTLLDTPGVLAFDEPGYPENSTLLGNPAYLGNPGDLGNPSPLGNPGPHPEVWGLEGALEFGLARHRPVQIARKELEVAQRKLREARRNLYPGATLKGSWTMGTASNVDFRETSFGLQVEHPLYYSGRLIQTYKQALVNLQVAEKRQSKVKADFALEIAQAYFQLVGAQASLKAQEGLVGETTEFLQRTQARYDAGLLTRLELLNVQAQVNQAKFQRLTAENDLKLARIKFLQRLGLDPEAQVEVPSEFPPLRETPIDLEEALQLAAQYRPDIQVNSLLVEFHEFEESIARAKGKLKVELSGFAGSSASAFETEPLDLGSDYFVGVKATQAWGPHGATLSTTTTKTSPRLGQTTRTDSTVFSGELGILNQLQGLTEIQQAQVGLEKSRHDLEEVKNTVFQEVQEAYISTTKARLQWEYAKQKVLFRQEQVKILQAQASVNEAVPSQVLEAIMKLNDEKVGEVQAQTNFHVALAKLNKAIGLPGHYH